MNGGGPLQFGTLTGPHWQTRGRLFGILNSASSDEFKIDAASAQPGNRRSAPDLASTAKSSTGKPAVVPSRPTIRCSSIIIVRASND